MTAYGVRPSINLKSDILISGGDGTREKPYKIEGDKKIAKVNDKLNSRVSGEYVNFDKKKYRIVGIENEVTKLTSVDYVRDDSGEVMKKSFGSDESWATSVTSNDDNYWGYYLNNTWYNNISETYKNMLVEGTYYLGEYFDNVSYKDTVCSESNTIETIKKCSKTSSTWTGYVGLSRAGEMFSAQLGEGDSSSSDMWLISPYIKEYSYVRYIFSRGYLYCSDLHSTVVGGVRPSINLNSDVIITGGNGTELEPYDIKLAS